MAPMMLPLLLSLVVSPTDDPPVKVWLNHDNYFQRGDKARVNGRLAEDGYVPVLRADAEGRLDYEGVDCVVVSGRAYYDSYYDSYYPHYVANFGYGYGWPYRYGYGLYSTCYEPFFYDPFLCYDPIFYRPYGYGFYGYGYRGFYGGGFYGGGVGGYKPHPPHDPVLNRGRGAHPRGWRMYFKDRPRT